MCDFAGKRIAIIGDVMLDKYINGDIERQSPEAPVPVLDVSSETIKLGGAANVALNVQALSATPLLIGLIGTGANGMLITNSLEEKGIRSQLFQDSTRRTTVKTRVLCANEHLIRVDSEDKHSIHQRLEQEIVNYISTELTADNTDAIILQDYNKGLLKDSLISSIIKHGKSQGIPIIVDPKVDNFYAYKGVTLFKPNKREMELALGHPIDTQILIKGKDMEKLYAELDCSILLTTLSSDGIIYFDGVKKEQVPTVKIDVADVCGAGDTVVSICACGIASGMNPKEISILANIGGSQVCESPGVVSVNAKRLFSDYKKEIT